MGAEALVLMPSYLHYSLLHGMKDLTKEVRSMPQAYVRECVY